MIDAFGYWAAILIVPIAATVFAILGPSVGTRCVGHMALFCAALLHIITGAARYAFFGLWAPDAVGYDRVGQVAARALSGDATFSYSAGKQGWPLFLGAVYALIGHNPLMVIVLMSFVVVVTAWLMAQVTSLYAGPGAGTLAFWLVACGPGFLIWGDTLLRESAIWLCVALAMLGRAIASETSRRSSGVLLMSVGIAALATVRGTLAAVLVITFAISWAMVRAATHRGVGRLVAMGAVLGQVTLLPFALGFAGSLFGYSLDSINNSREALARTANTSFGSVDSVTTPIEMVQLIANTLPRALLGPFPWELSWRGASLLFAVDALVCWVVAAVVLTGRRRLSSRMVWTLGMPAMALITALAVTSGNYGTLVRIRSTALLMMVPIVAIVLHRHWQARRQAQGRQDPDPQPETVVASVGPSMDDTALRSSP